MNNIPITKPYVGEEEERAVQEVLRSGWLVQGKKVEQFEQMVAEHEGVKYCCATTSCTTALELAMRAMDMSEGMDVIVPSFTFVATANSVKSTGATPIMFDINEYTYNLDADALEEYIIKNYRNTGRWINILTGNELWGIVPVHQFGLCADMEKINRIASTFGLKIIEDGACALGSKINEKHIGGFGNTVCISFHPRKSITTGEGGMLLTNDEKVYQLAVALRNHGSSIASDKRHMGKDTLLPQYSYHGYNYRMTDIQAAIGCEQMKKLDFILQRRQEIAQYYDALIMEKCRKIRVPYVPKGYYHSYQSYVCFLEVQGTLEESAKKRNEIMKELANRRIITRQGTHAMHKLDYYKDMFHFEDDMFLNANKCDLLTISLPVYVTISREEQEYVVNTLKELLEELDEYGEIKISR